jgi:hypothetical protein
VLKSHNIWWNDFWVCGGQYFGINFLNGNCYENHVNSFFGVFPAVPKLCLSRSKISKDFQTKPMVDERNPLNSSVLKYNEFDDFFHRTTNP